MGRCELRDSLNFVIHLELVREEGEERNEASPIGERLRVRRPVFSSFFLSSRSLFEASKNSNRVRCVVVVVVVVVVVSLSLSILSVSRKPLAV